MTDNDSAIVRVRVSRLGNGTALAALGVLAFSFSFPATVFALDGLGPWSATGIRGVLAAVIAGGALIATRAPRPDRADLPALSVVAVGCVIGFPLLTTLALQTSSTAHSAVVIGALPMATATIAAIRTRKHPSIAFCAAAGTGAAIVIGFALYQHHGTPTVADLYLLAALLLCAAGYAEGGRLSGRMPGWRVIAWGVVLSAPVNVVVTAVAVTNEPIHLSAKTIAGVAYIAAISQFGGFIVWYRGMALIGVLKASQIQLAQPLLTLLWAVLFLDEHLTPAVTLAAAGVLVCILITQRTHAT